MAQPKTGNSHLRGSHFIGSGLYVSGVARVAGAVRIGGTLNETGNSTFAGSVNLPSGQVQQTDLATGASGILYSANLTLLGNATFTAATRNKIYAATGACAPGLKFMAPNVAITIRGLAFSFATAPSHASGARFSIRSIPSGGAQVHKGYVTTADGKISVYKSGLSATIPARNAAGIAINLVGKTASGNNMNVTVYYTRN